MGGSSRLYFKAGGFAEKPSGWYLFWVARMLPRTAMVFRMPADDSMAKIVKRAKDKLDYHGEHGTFSVSHSDEAGVVRWLMAHRKKAQLGEYGR